MGLFSETIASRVTPVLQKIVLATVVILFIWFGYTYYVKASASVQKVKQSEDTANKGSGKKPATIYFFYTSWCGACKRSKPIWEAFVNSHSENAVIGDYTLTCTGFNCDKDDDANVQKMMTKYDVHHYPTVKLVVKDTVVELEGNVLKSNLDKLAMQLETM